MPDYRNYGEAVVLPTLQATNYILEQQQRKRQEEAALNKQIADSLTTYNPDKIRDEDVPGFYDRYNKVRDLSIQYKDAYRNPAKYVDQLRQINQAKDDLARYIVNSKARKELQKSADNLYTSHAKDLDMEDFMAKRKLLATPLDQSKDINVPTDITDFKMNVNEPDAKKFFEPVYKDNPLSIVETQSVSPKGEIMSTKSRQRDIQGTLTSISKLYDDNYVNGQKYFQDSYDNTPQEEKDVMQNQMRKIIPDFTLDSPKKMAYAIGMIGKMNLNMGGPVHKGYTLEAQMNKSATLQDRAAALADKKWKEHFNITQNAKNTAAIKKAGGNGWVPAMAEAMDTNDPETINQTLSELSDATPGVEYGYFNKDTYMQDPEKSKEMVVNMTKQRAGNRDVPTAEDLDKGYIWAKVPVGKKNGITKYRYMIASPARNDLKPSLNRILQAARGQKKFGGTTDFNKNSLDQ